MDGSGNCAIHWRGCDVAGPGIRVLLCLRALFSCQIDQGCCPRTIILTIFLTLPAAFAAICVWLTVRIVNRREMWAKWMLAAMVGVPALYVASFGPIVWLADRDFISRRQAAEIISPIIAELRVDDLLWSYGSFGCQDSFTMLHLWILAAVKPSSGELIDAPGA